MSETPLPEQQWYRWHAPYDEIRSAQTDRLGAVQEILSDVLDAAPPGPLRAVSICAGQARDLLPILISHPRGHDVTARMIELEPLNASFLHGALGSTALTGVEVVVADAGLTDAYAGAVPADLVLVSGPFANVSRDDARRTVRTLPQLCAAGAVVVWSTYDDGLADVDVLLDAFDGASFTELSVVRTGEFVAGAHRFTGAPQELVLGERMFRFHY